MSVEPTTNGGRRSVWPMVLGALVMMGVFWALTLLVRSAGPDGSREEEEKAEVRRKNYAELTTTYETEQTTYGWVDKEKGIVRLPIAEAKTLTIAALNEQKPRAAYPIATPAPAPTEPSADQPAAGATVAEDPTAAAAPAPSPASEATPAPTPAPEPTPLTDVPPSEPQEQERSQTPAYEPESIPGSSTPAP